MSMELVAFLRARLAEDKQVAREATPGPWVTANDHNDLVVMAGRADVAARRESDPWENLRGEALRDVDARHIARWDPARVLRAVAARRAIVDGFAALHENPERITDAALHLQWHVLRTVVAHHAAEYAEHPDYREEWRP